MLFATSAIIPRFDFHQVVLHEARPDDCSSARSTAPLVEPGVYLEYTKKIPKPFDLGIMAAGEGLEPSQTESESAVLPLHNPAIC